MPEKFLKIYSTPLHRRVKIHNMEVNRHFTCQRVDFLRKTPENSTIGSHPDSRIHSDPERW